MTRQFFKLFKIIMGGTVEVVEWIIDDPSI